MQITYLGTAAAEGIPAMFCACETCRRALKNGGRNIMTRSQMLIDDGLLIDFGIDTYQHFLKMGKTLVDIEHILITHSHVDHFTFEEFLNRVHGMCYNVKVEKLKMYMSKVVYDVMMNCLNARMSKDMHYLETCIDFIILQPFTTVKVGDYNVHVLPAVSHATKNEALIFAIEKDGRTLFYGNDIGFFDEDIDDYLLSKGVKINLLSLDCTKCDIDHKYYSHMNMEEGKRIAERFYKKGLLASDVKYYYTHFSHNGKATYDELVVIAKEKYGFEVAYDGLAIKV